MSAPTVVSAPGKVLVAGGYLVLDPAYSGVVVSTSSRFYTVVSTVDRPAPDAHAPIQIRVRSPQFVDAVWLYTVAVDPALNAVVVDPHAHKAHSTSANKFVHLALQRTLALAQEAVGTGSLQNSLAHGLDITIAGDNDFYSQRAQLAARGLPATLPALAQLPPFASTGVRLADVHKTGLGSSAALITSLVSALLLHLRVVPPASFAPDAAPAADGRALSHNLAQYVHCLAQGKVGSGFDVSAALFGSQLYTRFDPAVLEPLMADGAPAAPLLPIVSPSNPAWNYHVAPFKLPPLTRLMLADVDAGTDTPSFVGKVLKWRKEDSERANALWDALNRLNNTLSQTLLKLSELYAQDDAAYKKVVKYLSTLQSVQWLAHPGIPPEEQAVIEVFSDTHDLTQAVRAKMREMGELAGVPIEPPEQTELLNACVSRAGVIGGGVPGAGGYDAVWLLVCDPTLCPPEELPSTRVGLVWSKWTGLDVSPLAAQESAAGGARTEALDEVPGLRALVDAA
ncbi:Phosphomevalonate kinase [Obba rivulosa]|uniref:Phosphomevalonate kinase n=1 Tax=Obba rivulosa TaxID=1052685 RepID=A0A8E2APM0_9APHY|nr:Phosphomevalonate kinase [Obba rivulosa]